MEVSFATTFDEYVGWMAINSPHAMVLDWWRRLDLALREYAVTRPGPTKTHAAIEAAIAADPRLGSSAAAEVKQMRELRNAVAHDPKCRLPADDAVTYARRALGLISAISLLDARGAGSNLDEPY